LVILNYSFESRGDGLTMIDLELHTQHTSHHISLMVDHLGI